MPAGSRVRANNVYGTVTDNPLLIGGASFTSLGLSLLPVITSPNQHAVIVLDPKRVFGEPEIVVVTAHTAMGTTATITRGQYGTAARQHPQCTAWAHVPIGEDFIQNVASDAEITNPYRGQVIFDRTANNLKAYGNHDVWVQFADLGQWDSYTPVFANVTLGTGSTISAAYTRLGRTIHWRAHLILGTGGAVTGTVTVSLPVNATPEVFANLGAVGTAIYDDASASMIIGAYEYNTASTVRLLLVGAGGTYTDRANFITATTPFTWTTSDKIRLAGTYEAATSS